MFLTSLRRWAGFLARDPRRARLIPTHLRHVRRDPLEAGTPWMTLEAIEYLDRYLTKSMDMFEWGSGGSTVFFAERVRTVCTIEHDQSWGALVRHELNRREISNVDLEVVAPMVSSDPGTSVEEPIWDNRPEYANLDFRAYVETIEKWPDASLDLAVVDGRCRPDCIRYATRKVKPMGLLVVDNSERAAYRAALSTVAHWYTRHFFGPVVGCSLFSRTSVYVKPER